MVGGWVAAGPNARTGSRRCSRSLNLLHYLGRLQPHCIMPQQRTCQYNSLQSNEMERRSAKLVHDMSQNLFHLDVVAKVIADVEAKNKAKGPRQREGKGDKQQFCGWLFLFGFLLLYVFGLTVCVNYLVNTLAASLIRRTTSTIASSWTAATAQGEAAKSCPSGRTSANPVRGFVCTSFFAQKRC